jgi:hypothetical protein
MFIAPMRSTDAQHRVVEIKAMEEAMVEVLAQLRITENFRVVLAQVLAHRHREAAGATGRIHHHIAWGGLGHCHHQLDDVAGRAELAVGAGGGQLAEHVLVDVALGVAVFHRHRVEQLHHLGEQPRRGDREARVAHVGGVGRFFTAQLAQEREHPLAHHLEHRGGLA